MKHSWICTGDSFSAVIFDDSATNGAGQARQGLFWQHLQGPGVATCFSMPVICVTIRWVCFQSGSRNAYVFRGTSAQHGRCAFAHWACARRTCAHKWTCANKWKSTDSAGWKCAWFDPNKPNLDGYATSRHGEYWSHKAAIRLSRPRSKHHAECSSQTNASAARCDSCCDHCVAIGTSEPCRAVPALSSLHSPNQSTWFSCVH